MKLARMVVTVGKGERCYPQLPNIFIDDGKGETTETEIHLAAEATVEDNKNRLVMWLINGNYHPHIANWLGLVGDVPQEKAGKYIENVRMLHHAFVSLILSVGNDSNDQILGFKNCVKTTTIKTGRRLVPGTGSGPAFVICSGPSFHNFVAEPGHSDIVKKGLVLACDSALDSCLVNGIRPHMVVSTERYEEIVRLFADENYDIPLLSCPLQDTGIYKKFPNAIFLGNGLDYVQFFYPDLERHLIGPACSTAATVAAKNAGYSPIYLIGSDNAFHGDVHHGTKTPLDTTPSKSHPRIVVDGKLTIYPWLKIREWLDTNCRENTQYLQYEGIGLGYRHLKPATWPDIAKLPDREVKISTQSVVSPPGKIEEINSAAGFCLDVIKTGLPQDIFSGNTRFHRSIIELLSPSASVWYSVRSQSMKPEHIERVDLAWKNELLAQLGEICEISSRQSSERKY